MVNFLVDGSLGNLAWVFIDDECLWLQQLHWEHFDPQNRLFLPGS